MRMIIEPKRMNRMVQHILDGGGEGVMLQKHSSLYEHGRSPSLIKLKVLIIIILSLPILFSFLFFAFCVIIILLDCSIRSRGGGGKDRGKQIHCP